MSENFSTLANRYIQELIPYQPGKPIEEVERELGIAAIKMASNENPLGPSPLAMVAAHKALINSHIYPDGGSYLLKQALSQSLNVLPEQITIGNGSENILEMIVKAYLAKGDAAILSQYAFLTISILVKSVGADIIQIPARNFAHDIEKMVAAITKNTRILFIVNPNNPTGTYSTDAEITYLLKNVPNHILVVIDEAYHEYIQQEDYPDTLKLVTLYPNLVITRTFSKAYGLAALRLGYSISSPIIADILNRARLPFNTNSIAAFAGTAALSDSEHIQRSIDVNNNGMQQLQEGLNQMQLDFIPSLGNFISINVKTDGQEIYKKLLQQGVIVRPLHAYAMPHYLRVTIGTYEQNEKFLTSLNKVL